MIEACCGALPPAPNQHTVAGPPTTTSMVWLFVVLIAVATVQHYVRMRIVRQHMREHRSSNDPLERAAAATCAAVDATEVSLVSIVIYSFLASAILVWALDIYSFVLFLGQSLSVCFGMARAHRWRRKRFVALNIPERIHG